MKKFTGFYTEVNSLDQLSRVRVGYFIVFFEATVTNRRDFDIVRLIPATETK